jgi:hypothetical protein
MELYENLSYIASVTNVWAQRIGISRDPLIKLLSNTMGRRHGW